MDPAHPRPAVAVDAPQILELVLAMTAEVIDGPVPPDMERQLRADVASAVRGAPDDHMIVAERGGRLVGCGRVRVLDFHPMLRFGESPRHAYVELMYVVPGHRGSGIADAILGGLEEWAGRQGVGDVTLHNSPKARRFYERHGYAPLPEMHKRLPRG